MAFLDAWVNPEPLDPGLALFTAVRPLLPDVPHGTVLEIGAAEADWLTPASSCAPHLKFWGIDWRQRTYVPNTVIVRGDVMTWPCIEESLAAIVSISAIEHVGMGYYDNDPVRENGDTLTLQNAAKWLRPGGWIYFDVPFHPQGFIPWPSGRGYDDAAVLERLCPPGGTLTVLAYGDANHAGRLIDKPTHEPAQGRKYDYVALLWTKDKE